MRSVYGFLKSTLIGGFLFLLPIGIILMVLTRLVHHARRAGVAIHDSLFPGAAGNLLPTLIAILLLVLVAFLAGVLARTRFGVSLFSSLEGSILDRIPAYVLVRQAVTDLSGGSVRLAEEGATEVVGVRLDDMTVIGFLIERRADGSAVVFLPGAPTAFSGSVALVDGSRIGPTTLSPADVVQGMRRLGAGLASLRR
ncbi:MAG TPA: DUF502 domain-containing protein [Amaricoccus sp.]|nr:DUF502 domain-containing protein [Amaricoccus sp.]